MNKARRMVARQARALADAGFAVLRPDLGGCGDSGGEFVDASWSGWLDDIEAGCTWLLDRHPDATLWLWGLRAGCLLASAAAQRWTPAPHLLLWQPPPPGKALLQQFLRLRLAAQLADGGGKGVIESLRAELEAGRPVSVAGYDLPSAVARGLEQARLHPPRAGQVIRWLEVMAREPAQLLPGSVLAMQSWPNDTDLLTQVVIGPPFWQTTEIEDAPALIEATLQALEERRQEP